MLTQLDLGGLSVDVVRKDIKHVHLSVHPPSGRVRVSAPERMPLASIRAFALSRLGWIRRHRRAIHAQERDTPRELLDRESHYVWGRRYLLSVEEGTTVGVETAGNRLVLRARAGASLAAKMEVLETWYRRQVQLAAATLLAKWDARIGVQTRRCFVQHMKTRWGSSNPEARTIRLNTELAKKPPACLEYIVVHELVHFLAPNHGSTFVAHMDRLLPDWRSRREELNRLPIRHEDWSY